MKALLKFGQYRINVSINVLFNVSKAPSQMGTHLKSTSFFVSSNKGVVIFAYLLMGENPLRCTT
jgi:hypothetical protein